MALSGNFSTNKYTTSSHGTIGLNLSWTATQSIVNNTTKISWTLKSNGTMSSSYYVQAGPVTVTINGTKVLNTTSRFSMRGDGAYKKTGTITVSHAADGSKSVSMSVKAAIYSASVNCTGSKTYSLNKINRYALIDNATSFNDEVSPTVTYSNPAGTDLVTDLKVRLTWNSGSGATSYFSIPSADWGGGSYRMLLSEAQRTQLRNAVPNANSLEVTYDLMSTLNGTQYHSTKVATMNIVNASPTVGALSYKDTNATIVGITGSNQVIVQKQSTLQIHSDTSTANKGATITSKVLTFNGTNYTPDGSGNVTLIKPNIAGTYTATLKITDSRGNAALRNLSIPIRAWSQPSADYSLQRTQDFTANEAVLNVKGNISSIVVESVQKNTLEITESHRERGTGNWSTPVTLTNNTDTTISSLDYQKEYDFKITVSDSFTRAVPPSTEYTPILGKGIPIVYFDAKRHSFAVNGVPDADEQLFVGGIVKCDDLDMTPKNFSYLVSVTKTSGAWSNTQRICYRYGNMIFLRLRFQGDGTTVNKGSDAFKGTISMPYLTPHGTTAVYYVSGATVVGFIGPDGNITIHVTGDNATLASNGTIDLRFNYMYY